MVFCQYATQYYIWGGGIWDERRPFGHPSFAEEAAGVRRRLPYQACAGCASAVATPPIFFRPDLWLF